MHCKENNFHKILCVFLWFYFPPFSMRLKSTTDLGIEQSDFRRVKLFEVSPLCVHFSMFSHSLRVLRV
jgi:hypothetical protein